MAAAIPWVVMGLSALGSLSAAQGAKADAKATAQAQTYNAQVADRNAQVSRDQAEQEAMMSDRKARAIIGAQRAAYGASGITVEGTPLDVLVMSAANAELDKQTILYKGELRAMGYTDEATLDRFSANTAIDRGNRQAGSAILLGLANAGRSAYGMGLLNSGSAASRTVPISAGSDDWSY